jgi:Ni/Co efflux regulator RcnB
MSRALAVLMALLLSFPAFAASERLERERLERERGGQQQTQPQAGPQAVGPQAVGPQGGAPQAQRPAQNAPQATGPQPQRPVQNAPRSNDGGFLGRANPKQAAPPPNAPAPEVVQNRDRREFDGNRNAGPDRRDFDRDRRDFDRGRDFRGERDRADARRAFSYRGRQYYAVRGPEFRYPRGWSYRHWNRGDLLPSFFLAAPYFFDYGFLGLPPPPRAYRWVRYGPDALLVNEYDGRIIDVIYDAFY